MALACSVQNFKTIVQFKRMLGTKEILEDWRLRWVSWGISCVVTAQIHVVPKIHSPAPPSWKPHGTSELSKFCEIWAAILPISRDFGDHFGCCLFSKIFSKSLTLKYHESSRNLVGHFITIWSARIGDVWILNMPRYFARFLYLVSKTNLK